MNRAHLVPFVGVGGAAVVAAIWVVLTVQTGLTFHFYPLLITIAPALVVTRIGGAHVAPRGRAVLVGWGVGAVVLAWLVLGALESWPTATFVEGQWGGAGFEVIVFTTLGAVLATRMLRD